MSNPLKIEVPEGLPFIEFEREFDAPVETLFRAHQDPELIKQWLGPRRRIIGASVLLTFSRWGHAASNSSRVVNLIP